MPKKIAVVTGASGGLGREYARLFALDPSIDEVWAIARNEEKLNRLKKSLGDKIKIFSLDLSDKTNIQEFGKVLEKVKPWVSFLVNNAGFAKFCSYADLSIDVSVNMIDVNCSAVVAMGLICIPFMRPGSRIVNVASQASFQPLPYLNIYSATKAFLRNYSRALNVELRERGITVTAVCPGWMDTGLFDRAEIGAKKAPGNFFGMTSPRAVAAQSLRDARKGRDISVCSLYVKVCHAAAKLLPQRVMMQLWLIQQGLWGR